MSLRDQFVTLAVNGPSERKTLDRALAHVMAGARRGGPVDHAKEKATDLLAEAFFSIMELLPVFALRVSPEGTGVEDIPSPACMEKHLPKDRKWTEDDVERAWNICLKSTSR